MKPGWASGRREKHPPTGFDSGAYVVCRTVDEKNKHRERTAISNAVFRIFALHALYHSFTVQQSIYSYASDMVCTAQNRSSFPSLSASLCHSRPHSHFSLAFALTLHEPCVRTEMHPNKLDRPVPQPNKTNPGFGAARSNPPRVSVHCWAKCRQGRGSIPSRPQE